MSLPIKKSDTLYTYADYLTWNDDERWELIDGVPYLMAPAASPSHQGIGGELYLQIGSFLKGSNCKVYYAPFDVRLFPEDGDSDNTVVQPDIVVICDVSKIDKHGLSGVPDMVIEILSPSNTNNDRITKFQLYHRAGVREYWIVDPMDRNLTTFILKDDEYITKVYGSEDSVPVHILDGLIISLSEVFEEVFLEEAPSIEGSNGDTEDEEKAGA